MKFATGDDVGVLKIVDLLRGTDTSDVASDKPEIQLHKSPDRSNYVQAMTLIPLYRASDDRELHNVIAVARKGAIVELMSEAGEEIAHWSDRDMSTEDPFVTIAELDGTIITCTANGWISCRNQKENSMKPYRQQFPSPVSKLRVDTASGLEEPLLPGVFAIGGKEHDLELWQAASDNRVGRELEGGRSAAYSVVWRAKNVKNDELDLRVPVWISDLQFLESYNGRWRIATCTRFRHVRIYDTSRSRRPILSVEIGESPLVSLVVSNEDELILSDSHSGVCAFSISQKRVTHLFKGAAGSAISLAIGASEHGPVLAAVGLDRYLRVYDVQTRRQIGKVFLKTKMTGVVCIDGNDKIEPEDGQWQDPDEEQGIWSELEETEPESEKTPAKRRRVA